MGVFNPMIFAMAALVAESAGASARQALPVALLGSTIRPPMMGLILALAVARDEVVPYRPRRHRMFGQRAAITGA